MALIQTHNLFDEESFSVPIVDTEKLIKKIASPKKVVDVEKRVRSVNTPIEERLAIIKDKVEEVLGRYKDSTRVIYSREELHNYVTKCIENKIVAIDTETNNSLDPLGCKLMGLCLYTPGEKQVYIPVNHVNYITKERLPNQVTEQDIKEELERLSNTFTITHNGKFDYKVLRCTCNVKIRLDWDTFICELMLDENKGDGKYKLKVLYGVRVDPTQDPYDIESLFKSVLYEDVDPEIFALYSATDPYMTYMLYLSQLEEISLEDNKHVYDVFLNVEMPVEEVLAEMELTGVSINEAYTKRLDSKYTLKLNEMDVKINEELNNLKPKINAWRLTKEANEPTISEDGKVGKSKSEQLEEVVNLNSPIQLSILLYDVLKVKSVDKENPRGTGKDILKRIKLPLCKLLTERKELTKLMDSFISVLPGQLHQRDNRIHCNFKQLGAATGRQSCTNPNLQQIPSHNKEVRMIFTAKDGYVMCGSDFSQQEPRLLSYMTQDKSLINAYLEGKDLYAIIASNVYHNNYEDNLENFPDGTNNPDGELRRSKCKSILLGLMYGRGVKSIAEQIDSTVEEAQSIMDGFFTAYPVVKKWMDASVEDAKKLGYTTDMLGRRRRLPNLMLPKYSVSFKNKSMLNLDFNPFLECKDRQSKSNLLENYRKKANEINTYKEYKELKESASSNGILIESNVALIADDSRKCINARIQGSAATMTKIAMSKIYRDEELNSLGFKLTLSVHDELIGECPEGNAQKVADRLSYIMSNCISDFCNVPFKCDAIYFKSWYEDKYSSAILKEYKACKKKNMTDEESINEVIKNHSESTENYLRSILHV